MNAAYGAGLLSENTLAYRLDLLLSSRLIDPAGLVGDLRPQVPRARGAQAARDVFEAAMRRVKARFGERGDASALLALDWNGGGDLLLGRHLCCDIVLPIPTVSRRHALLSFRDGSWILRDLESTNGTLVNGERVGRCELRPGDLVMLAKHQLTVD